MMKIGDQPTMAPRKPTRSPETETEPIAPKVPKASAKTKAAPKTKAASAKGGKAATKALEPAVEAEAIPKAPAKRGCRKASCEVPAEPKVVPAEAAPKPRARKSAPKPAEAPLPAEAETISAGLPELGRVALEAIRAGKAIELIFLDADANPPRTFEARQIIYDLFTDQWFLWGWDRRYNAERHHRLDHLLEVNPVEGPGRSAQGPYPEGTPANQLGGWLGGEPIPVKALLMKQWIFAVRQAPAPFPAFRMEEQEEGKALVSFTGTDLRAIARWCMQFGDGIQVLEPQRLADRMRQVAVAWGAKLAPAPAPQPSQPKARPEPRPESKPEPKPESREARREPKPEPRREEPRRERRPEPRREESDTKPAKAGRVEVRLERL